MKHPLLVLMVSLLFLASFERNQPKQQDPEQTFQGSMDPRNGIQWGEIHLDILDPIENYTSEAWLLYTTADDTIDSLKFRLPFNMGDLEEFFDRGGGRIEEQDMNNDGIPDLQIGLGCVDGGCNNVNYEGFVWDQEKSAFVLVPNYWELMNPDILDDGIVACEHEWDEGALHYYCDMYQWVDGALVKTDEWHISPDEENDDYDTEE